MLPLKACAEIIPILPILSHFALWGKERLATFGKIKAANLGACPVNFILCSEFLAARRER